MLCMSEAENMLTIFSNYFSSYIQFSLPLSILYNIDWYLDLKAIFSQKSSVRITAEYHHLRLKNIF